MRANGPGNRVREPCGERKNPRACNWGLSPISSTANTGPGDDALGSEGGEQLHPRPFGHGVADALGVAGLVSIPQTGLLQFRVLGQIG